MIERDLEHYEDYEPRVRPTKAGSKPRSKNRPQHDSAEEGLVIAVDRGRYRVILNPNAPDERLLTCTRARELRNNAIVTGDRVDVVGDTSGSEGSLARIVRIHPRSTVLRRSADDSDTFERIIVANADQLLMVVAAASPEPRLRLVDRYLVAALDARITPILCITKTDLASGDELRRYVMDAGVTVIERSPENPAHDEIAELLKDHITVAVGHSGVGKSTLVNDLVPGADRAVGDVNEVTGRGRHTSSSSQALRIPEGGWVIDTPGVRSFGLGHVSKSAIVEGFEELLPHTLQCPKGCPHLAESGECTLTQALNDGILSETEQARAHSLQRLMATLQEGPEHSAS
jgi:ribosome biogenesis GTPase / thiamine phosphate phosphatase